MTRLMLRASASAMTAAAAMLMGVALVIAAPASSLANAVAACPAEPQNGACAGTCSKANWKCTPGTETFPDGSTNDVCGCVPPANPVPVPPGGTD